MHESEYTREIACVHAAQKAYDMLPSNASRTPRPMLVGALNDRPVAVCPEAGLSVLELASPSLGVSLCSTVGLSATPPAM